MQKILFAIHRHLVAAKWDNALWAMIAMCAAWFIRRTDARQAAADDAAPAMTAQVARQTASAASPSPYAYPSQRWIGTQSTRTIKSVSPSREPGSFFRRNSYGRWVRQGPP